MKKARFKIVKHNYGNIFVSSVGGGVWKVSCWLLLNSTTEVCPCCGDMNLIYLSFARASNLSSGNVVWSQWSRKHWTPFLTLTSLFCIMSGHRQIQLQCGYTWTQDTCWWTPIPNVAVVKYWFLLPHSFWRKIWRGKKHSWNPCKERHSWEHLKDFMIQSEQWLSYLNLFEGWFCNNKNVLRILVTHIHFFYFFP